MKQRDLFTRRWRTVKHLPAPREDNTLMAIISLLKRAAPRDAAVMWWHTPNEGTDRANPARVKKLIAMGMVPGFPDLCVLYRGKLYVMELKRDKEPTTEQLGVLAALEDCGAIVGWANGYEQAVAFLRKNGLLPRLTGNT